jgi:hypothetical protein
MKGAAACESADEIHPLSLEALTCSSKNARSKDQHKATEGQGRMRCPVTASKGAEQRGDRVDFV